MSILAYLSAIGKCVIYGATPFFTGALSDSGIDVLDLLSLRFLLSFVVFFILKTVRVIKIDFKIKDIFVKNPKTPFIKNLLFAALFEPVLYTLFETLGISMTNGVTTAVILSAAPVFYCVGEFIFFRKYPSFWQGVFLTLGMVGAAYIAVCTSTEGGSSSFMGIVFLVLSLTVGALFCVFSRKSSEHFSPLAITFVSSMLGAVCFNSVNIVRHLIKGDILHYFDPYFDPQNLLGFAVLGIGSTIFATIMSNYALSKIRISTFSAFGGVSTIVTVLIGVIFADEKLMYFHYIGFPLILARMIGVCVIDIVKDRKKMKAEALAEPDNKK